MRFIEHIIEPHKLLLAWQSSDETHRIRYIVGELYLEHGKVNLRYLTENRDFQNAQTRGFEYYPAFQDLYKVHDDVLDAFMRRLPPRKRGDFQEYLEGLRLQPGAALSDFALLGYSGAKLPSDGFSVIHAFENADGPCELLVEVAGFRHMQKDKALQIQIGNEASFVPEFNETTQEEAVRIFVGGQHIGYVNRGLVGTFLQWLRNGRLAGAWVEKMNGKASHPMAYLFVKVTL